MYTYKIICLYSAKLLTTVTAKTERGALRKANRYAYNTVAVKE